MTAPTLNATLLLRWSGVAASVGALLWGYKSVAILVTGDQPDFVFEVAPFFFGVSLVALVYALRGQLRRPDKLLVGLAWLAVAGGGFAAVVYILEGDDGLFGPGLLVAFVSMIVLLFLIGGDIRRNQLLPRWSFAPWYLAWAYVGSIPLGAVLSGINERLLEVSLLVVVAGWVTLAVATLSPQTDP